VEKLIFLLNEKMFDIKKSGNPKLYIEILLLDFMSSNLSNCSTSGEVVAQNKENVSVDVNKKDISVSENNVINNISNQENMVVSLEVHNDNDSLDESVDADDSISSDEPSLITVDKGHTILNINDIINARVNNALALADKQFLRKSQENLSILNDFTFDQNFGYLVCEILNSKFRVASSDIIVISYEYDSIVQQNLENLEEMEKIYNDLTGSNIKFAIITDEEWSTFKQDYINKLKAGEIYDIIPEPHKVFKKEESNDIINNDATLLFGDIVEYEE